MYDYGFRDYSPVSARFTTVDPIRDGSNWFSYVVNDPVNYVDPLGLNASDRSGSAPTFNSGMMGQNVGGNFSTSNGWVIGNGFAIPQSGATLDGFTKASGVPWSVTSWDQSRNPKSLQVSETIFWNPNLPFSDLTATGSTTNSNVKELIGWIKLPQCGWNDNAPQTAAGYHSWMDTASAALFNIDHAEVDMGDYTIRFWKGDYGSTARFITQSDPKTFLLSLFIGMAGGEIGIYNNDGKGLGNDGGSLMSPAELDNLGIANVNLVVKNQNGKTIASVDGKRAWPNVYNFFDHSKKADIYTETTISFSSKEKASSFYNLLNDKIEKSDYNYQFDVKPNGNEVTITWGKTK